MTPVEPHPTYFIDTRPTGNKRSALSPAVNRTRQRQRVVRSVGFATYYGRDFDGRLTASGVRFDTGAMMAAHPTYSFGTIVRVTNLRNGASTRVRIVDRGPTRSARRQGVIIDVSAAAARSLGFIRSGRAPVRVEILGSESPRRGDE